MCNPRRITVTATRELAEAWQREVSRTAELSAQVIGEARVRQLLTATLGHPALRALEARLAAGVPGWRAVEGGWCYEVEGGHVVYSLEEQALEIVATLSAAVRVSGRAGTVLTGNVAATLEATADAEYYEDGHAASNETRARIEAETAARRQLDQAVWQRLDEAQQQAEAAVAADLDKQARRVAADELERAAAARRAALAERAQDHLETVGLRCRQAFNQVLAQAYRDAILAYARRHGADGISCRDDAGVLEIEFFVDR